MTAGDTALDEYILSGGVPEDAPLRRAVMLSCPSCATRIDEAEHALASLALDVAPVATDPAMRGRVLARIRGGMASAPPLAPAPATSVGPFRAPAPHSWFPQGSSNPRRRLLVAAGLLLLAGAWVWQREQVIAEQRGQLAFMTAPRLLPAETGTARLFLDADGATALLVAEGLAAGPLRVQQVSRSGEVVATAEVIIDKTGQLHHRVTINRETNEILLTPPMGHPLARVAVR